MAKIGDYRLWEERADGELAYHGDFNSKEEAHKLAYSLFIPKYRIQARGETFCESPVWQP